MKPLLSERTNEEIGSIAAERNCRLLEIEAVGTGASTILRLVLERLEGEPVSIEDCEAVSKEVSTLLDAADEIPHRYRLEVSSAGLDRRLYSLEDARRFVGRRVRVQTHSPVTAIPADPTGEKGGPAARNFKGTLENVEGDRLRVIDAAEGKIYNVRFGDIRIARLDFEWPERRRQ